MNTFARSFALLASFSLVAVGCGQDQTNDTTSTDDALLTCDGFHHGDPGKHRGHHHGRHHHHHDGGGGSTGTGGSMGTGGQPHLTGMAGTTGTGGSTGMAGSMGTGGTGGGMVDPRCAALSGMVSWWQADGNYDDAVGSNDGTTGGAVTFAPGVKGEAFNLSGVVGANVVVPDNATLMMSGAVTVDAWINAAQLGGRIVDKATPNDGYMLDMVGDQIRMFIATDAVFSVDHVPAGQWVHVAGVFDGNGLGVYINGALSANSVTNGHSIIPNNQPLHIGADLGGNSEFIGMIDEARVWSRALSADEIAQLFWQASGTNCP